MKKVILVLFSILGFATASFAGIGQGNSTNNFKQPGSSPKALGIRLGNGIEVSYQHSLRDNFIEMDLGLMGFTPNLNATAVYNFMIAQPNWSTRGQWGFYAGPGLGLGFGFGYDYNYFNVGFVGQIGLEYSFWFPLQLSIDLRPQIGFITVPDYGALFYFGSYIPAISLRYKF